MNTGILAAFGTLACWTIGTFAFTLASQRSNPASVNRVRLVLASVLLAIVSVLIFDVPFQLLISGPSINQWFWLGLSGIVGLTLGDYFAFTAYRILGSSKTSLFSTFAPVAALLLGMVMLNETINTPGLIGMMVSTAGIIWFVQANRKEAEAHHDEKHVLKGVTFAILGAVGQGLGLVCAKKGLSADAFIHPVHATWIRMTIGALAAYSTVLFRINIWQEAKEVTASSDKVKPLLIGTTFGPVIGVSLSLLAATQLPVGIAQTIFSLLPITVMIAAVVLGKEKVKANALLATAICLCGVLILVWRNELLDLFSFR